MKQVPCVGLRFRAKSYGQRRELAPPDQGVANDDGSHGVFGSSTAGGTGVTGFVGSATGAIGSCGVRGTTGTGAAGVLGQTFGDGSGGDAGPAVQGSSGDGAGVSGVSGSTDGTEALTFGNGYGHYSLHFSAQPGGGVLGVSVLGSGVEGFTFASIRDQPDVAAVRGQSANGFAGPGIACRAGKPEGDAGDPHAGASARALAG